MKLGKEEIQKIVLGVILLVALLYGYFAVLLGPLKKKRAASQVQIAELTKQVREARGQIRKEQDMEASLPAAMDAVKQVKSMIPDGAPVAWFPPMLVEHFKRDGVNKAAARNTGEHPEKELPGFRRMTWNVDFSQVEFFPFAEALADFENNEPLAEIAILQLDAGSSDVEFEKAFLSVRTTVTQ